MQENTNMFTLITFHYLVFVVVVSTSVLGFPTTTFELEAVDYPQLVHNIAKKDIFISRGWGAAGMPYSKYYLSKQPPLEMMEPHTRKQENLVNVDDDGKLMNYDEMEQPAKQTQQREEGGRKYSLPQLFVSYGWGPMG